MSRDRLDERLDAMLAPLRDRPAHLDEVAQARVRVRLEAAIASADATDDARAVRGWRRRSIAVGLGFAAAAAIVVIGLIAALRSGRTGAGAMATANAGIGATVTVSSGIGAGAETIARGGDRGDTGNMAATAAKGGAGSSGDGNRIGSSATPITIAAGESTHVAIGDAAVTVYGPGTVSSTPEGTEVDAAGLVIDRTRGDTPWSMRYHGVKIVAMRATFALDHGTVTRATVMRGEIELLCPWGTLTIRSGASGTCETAEDAPAIPAPQPRAPALARAPEKPSVEELRMQPVAPNPPAPPVAAIAEPPAERVAASPVRAEPPAGGALRAEPVTRDALRTEPPARELIVDRLRPLPARVPTPGYAAAESALRRGDLDAARTGLLAIIDDAPDSLDAAMALLDLARLAKTRGEPIRALGYLDRLARHPHRAELATAAAHLRAMLAASAAIQRPLTR
jgi:hypothetical protein